LKLLLETGLIGLLLFYYLLFRGIHLCQLYVGKFTNNYDRGICLGILFVLVLFVLRSFICQVFDIPGVLFFTWGGVGWLSNMISKEQLVNRCKKRQAVQNEAPT